MAKDRGTKEIDGTKGRYRRGQEEIETTVENRVVQSADGKQPQQCTTGVKGFTGVKGSNS